MSMSGLICFTSFHQNWKLSVKAEVEVQKLKEKLLNFLLQTVWDSSNLIKASPTNHMLLAVFNRTRSAAEKHKRHCVVFVRSTSFVLLELGPHAVWSPFETCTQQHDNTKAQWFMSRFIRRYFISWKKFSKNKVIYFVFFPSAPNYTTQHVKRPSHFCFLYLHKRKLQQTFLLAVLSMHRSVHWLSVVVRNGL